MESQDHLRNAIDHLRKYKKESIEVRDSQPDSTHTENHDVDDDNGPFHLVAIQGCGRQFSKFNFRPGMVMPEAAHRKPFFVLTGIIPPGKLALTPLEG